MTPPTTHALTAAPTLDPAQQDRAITLALLLANGTFIAGIYAFAKITAGAGIPVLGTLAWQMLFAAAVIAVVAAARGEWPQWNATNLRYAALAGALGITGPNLVSFTALAHLPAGLVGVITALSPLFTYAIAVALRLEPVLPHRALGIALGMAGVLGIVLPRGALPTPEALPWALLAMAAPLLLAGGNVYRSVAWPAGLKPLGAAALLLLLQAIVLVPLALVTDTFVAPRALLGAGDVALLGAGVLTVAFYLGAFELQKRGGPVVVGQLGYVITVASLAIGALAFGERPSPFTLLAVAVVFAGVMLVNRKPAVAPTTGAST